MEATQPKVSVVIATYNRLPMLERLLANLAEQTLEPSSYEVVVVDDGSREPVAPALTGKQLPYHLHVETQANAGQAAARHNGVQHARGDLLVFTDDDMQVGPDFLAQHLSSHPEGSRRAVLGAIKAPPDEGKKPLWERWHQKLLESFTDRCMKGVKPRGNNVYTANFSTRRADYLAVGGFDVTLRRFEDAELGLRLEKAGVEIAFNADAVTLNSSDHTSWANWKRLTELYGISETRVSHKHPDLRHASPWRFWPDLNRVSKPLLFATSIVPPVSRSVVKPVFLVAQAAEKLGFEAAAMAGTTLVYGMNYYRGVRVELGSAANFIADKRRYFALEAGGAGNKASPLQRFVADVMADHAIIRHYEEKYGSTKVSSGNLVRDAVQKVGLQIMVGVRGMRLVRDLGIPLAPKVASRLLRHLYGSDIHWDTEFAPGVVLVHGMGLAISNEAHVGPGCIIFQNVCLGMGIDPVTRATGAPTLEGNVHVGPGATLLGPITIGEGSKIMAGCTVTASVPPGSIVEAPTPVVRSRAKGPKGGPRSNTAA